MKKIVIDEVPKLWLYAVKEIATGEELTYDYGVKNLPWRNLKVTHKKLFSYIAASLIFSSQQILK